MLITCFASGVNAESVTELLSYLNVYLVATGVEATPDDPQIIQFYKEAGIPAVKVGYLDADRVSSLAAKIHI